MSTGMESNPGSANRAVIYQIRVKGWLNPEWAEWFEGMQVISAPHCETLLVGRVIDQPALHGLLARVRDFNLELISVEQVDCERGLL
jgi:hypothetical protein